MSEDSRQSSVAATGAMPALTTSERLDTETIGIIAGWGDFPIVVARSVRSLGYKVIGQGIKHHVDPLMRELCDEYQELGLAKLGSAIRFFKKHGVTHATMAGKVHKIRLFNKLAFLKHLPDFEGLKTFFPHFVSKTKDKRDDTLLGAVVTAFEKNGITFAPATHFAPELLIKDEFRAGGSLSKSQRLDIEFGWQLAKEMGRLDVGQTVVVKGQAVLAVEAIEGTDECIERAGKLCPQGGFTVVKVAKPQQDSRFDVPTIGVGTLKSIKQAGGCVLAVEAGNTILIDESEVQRFANQYGIKVVASSDGTTRRTARAA
ncbi:MAG: LpxI family protein [Pirellulaceae bacterium]